MQFSVQLKTAKVCFSS